MVEVTEADKKLLRDLAINLGNNGSRYDRERLVATHRIEAAKAERDRIVGWLREAQVEAMKQGKLEASAAMTGFADALESKP